MSLLGRAESNLGTSGVNEISINYQLNKKKRQFFFFFFWPHLHGHAEGPRPGMEPTPQQ